MARGGTVREGRGRGQGDRVAGAGRGLLRLLTGFANRCDLVTAPTATALRLLREHGLRAPSKAVSNGVDLDRSRTGPGGRDEARALRSKYALPPDGRSILSVGRLSPEKRGTC